MSLVMKKSQQSKKQNNFLNDFIEKEMYLQNPPMTTDKFINFCKKRGIQTTKEELEFFEKEKLLYPTIRVKFYSRYDVFKEDIIGSYHNDLLLSWLEEGNLFDPSTKDFQSWGSFVGEELEHEKQKVVSFYSSFQIHWLEKIKQISTVKLTHNKTAFSFDDCEIAVKNGKVYLTANLNLKIEISDKEEIPTSRGESYKPLEHKEALIERFKSGFDLKTKKESLRKYDSFDKILQFFLSVQYVYFPYAKSGGGKIQITGDTKKWQEARRNFKLDDVLKKLDLKVEDIAKWYKVFSDEAQKILGVKRDDWIQLWKNITWSKKDKLKGNIRLGVEYLQWAVMLKRIVEEHLQKETLDIDEVSNIGWEDILKIDTGAKDKPMVILRHLRNKRYSDKDKNYYHDRYKRLFYLANDFGLDYQPRVTVFVEGETEKKTFPDIFEWLTGDKLENLGVEIIDIGGVDKFFGSKQSFKDPKKRKIFVTNLVKLISYNFNRWQVIPFFIGDYGEGNVENALKDKNFVIKWGGVKYGIPEEWQFWWGESNGNKPFKGKDFETANFSDDEIAKVLSKILSKKIHPSDVRKQRNTGKGIKQVDEDVEKNGNKIKIAEKLIKNLFDKYEKTKDEKLFERPIFKALGKIGELANSNHPPVDRKIEVENRKYFKKKLQKTA